jgi:hypothetical protein
MASTGQRKGVAGREQLQAGACRAVGSLTVAAFAAGAAMAQRTASRLTPWAGHGASPFAHKRPQHCFARKRPQAVGMVQWLVFSEWAGVINAPGHKRTGICHRRLAEGWFVH